MKKISILISIVTALSLALCACHAVNTEPAAKESRDPSEEKPIALTLWHIWTTDIDANRITLEAGLDAVKQAYPNISFDVDATETETYKTRIKTSMAVNDVPDIFFAWGGGFPEAFIETDKVLCLDSYYTKEVEKALPREFLQYQTYDGSIYGFPFMRTYATLFANQQIFEENGLSIPATYDALLASAQTLSEKGIIPIAVAGQDMWPLMFHYATLAMREVGPEMVQSALNGDSTFMQQGFIDAGYKFLELKHAGAFGEDCLSQAVDPTADLFKAGDAAMYYYGSWASGGFTADIPIAGNIVPIIYPGKGGPYDNTFLGGAVDCWMASVDTAYPDEAASAIILLAQTVSTLGGETGMALPMWDHNGHVPKRVQLPGYSDEDYTAVGQIYDQVVTLTDGVGKEESVLWWDTYLGINGTRCNELIVQMFTEDITPEQFVIAMDGLVDAED